ncbi:slc39a1 [Symbiodinium natans]|uniref:Slc39a1 protein n=1 Tax=Symbiodinium natans TaxID=878477 RepID=A0A812QZY8_9DINO|nr:slc39a1 [Symbiodinium natans]
MQPNTTKVVSSCILALVALGGSILSRYTAELSTKLVRVCNAGAGGVLLAVVLVHMLAENSEELGETGEAFYRCFRPSAEGESFPLGFALLGLGFLASLSMEVFVPDAADAKESYSASEDDYDSDSDSSEKGVHIKVDHGQSFSGALSALFGLCLHSLVEGTAAGSQESGADFDSTFVAIIAHKGFATFSAGSLMLGAVSNPVWWALMVLLALMTPAGVVLGMTLEQSLEGPVACGLICFTSGCLLRLR